MLELHYFFEKETGKLQKIINTTKRKEKVEVNFTSTEKEIADIISIKHNNFKLTIDLEKLKKLPIPLVVYYFGNAKSEVYQKVKKLKSGAFSVNQVVRYIGDPRLPFGGVEGSGFGRYHGESSIQAFTYEKVSYKQATLFDWKRQYPPYDKKDISWLIRFRKWLF